MMLLRQLAYFLTRILMIPVHVAHYLMRLASRLAAFALRVIDSFARPALRFLAYLLLLVAAVALVADATPALNGIDDFRATPFAEHVAELAPQSLARLHKAVVAVHPWIWDYGLGNLIQLPTFLLFGVLGGCAAYAGRRREQIDVFIN